MAHHTSKPPLQMARLSSPSLLPADQHALQVHQCTLVIGFVYTPNTLGPYGFRSAKKCLIQQKIYVFDGFEYCGQVSNWKH